MRRIFGFISVIGLLGLVIWAYSSGPRGRSTGSKDPSRVPALAQVTMFFEPNQGQTDPSAKYLSRGRGYALLLGDSEATLLLQSEGVNSGRAPDVLRIQHKGSNPDAVIQAEDLLPGKSNYFIGKDPKKWRPNIPHYSRVRYQELYPGIDLVYYGNPTRLEYDFIVHPGADWQDIEISFEGAKGLALDEKGNLVISLEGGEVVQSVPVTYQEAEGQREMIASRYVMNDSGTVGFQVAAYDRNRTLVIDPILSYATYLGGSSMEQGTRVAVDAAGNAYLTGLTFSVDFPTSSPYQGALAGGADAFVTKLSADGSTLVYSTFLGGSSGDGGFGIDIDSSGNAYIVGFTFSADFPMVGAYQSVIAGSADAFVTKINPDGSALVYSTYLGGTGDDRGWSMKVDSSGNAHLSGWTSSADFPTLNPYQAVIGGGQDSFMTKFDASGSGLVFSTYFGGSLGDSGSKITVDGSGNVYLAGTTQSLDLPVLNAFQPAMAGGDDAFVVKLDGSGSGVFVTYLGGATGLDDALGLDVDSAGNIFVSGYTLSTDFPLMNPQQPVFGGIIDAFVTQLNPSGSALIFSTYLGGSAEDGAVDLVLGQSGDIVIVGSTRSTDFPLMNPVQGIYAGEGPDLVGDSFLTRFDATGSIIKFSTYFGGSGDDAVEGLAIDGSGNMVMVGYTNSTDLPVANPYQGTYGGSTYDGFVLKILPDPTPTPTAIPPTMTPTFDPGERVKILKNVFRPLRGESPSIYLVLDKGSQVIIQIYDRKGRLVRNLLDEPRSGTFAETWDGLNDEGLLVPSGIYHVHIKTKFWTESRKVVVKK